MLIETPLPIVAVEVLIGIGAVYHIVVSVRKWFKKREETPTVPRTRNDYVLGIFYSLVCVALWSLSYISLSYVTPKVDLLNINIVLLGSASIFLLAGWGLAYLFDRTAGSEIRLNVNWKTAAPWIIVAANLASFLLFIYSLHFISASQTITLQKMNPLFVVIIAVLWLKKKPTTSTVSAVFLVILGAFLIMVNDQFGFTGGPNVLGSGLAILAGASFAVFTVGLEKIEEDRLSRTQALGFMTLVFVLSYIGIVSIGYLYGSSLTFDYKVTGILLLNGLRVALVYGFYQAAVRRIGALLTCVVVALEVPVTMLWDWKLLNNVPGGRLAIGAIAILFGATTLIWDRISRMKVTESAA